MLAWVWAPWLNADEVQRRHETQFAHKLGRFGYPFHICLALLLCAGVVGPMAAVELGGIAVAVCFLTRLPFVWRGVGDAVRQPATILLLAWASWVWALVWRDGFTDAGVHEASYQRWGPALVVLWAVMDRRRWMIAALGVGFALAQFAQLLEFAGYAWGVEQLVWSHPPAPDPAARVSGWWHQPAVGGSMLVACLGLHLGPAVFGGGRVRVMAVVACVATALAMVATGTRGAWIAGLTLTGLVVLAAVMLRVKATGAGGSKRVIVGVLIALGLAGGCVFVLDGARERMLRLGTEARAAWVRGELDSDVGGRILAARAALDAAASHPIAGIGPGGFNTHLRTYAEREGVKVSPHRFEHLKTAHNTVLHTLATQGVVGVLLLFAAVLCAIAAGLRPHVSAGLRGAVGLREHLGTYASAPALALLGLVIAGAFDTTTLNASTAALSTILIALCGTVRPSESDRRLTNLGGGTQ